MQSASCPACRKNVLNVVAEQIPIQDSLSPAKWSGMAYLCPWCRAILSVQTNPMTLFSDIVLELANAMGKKPGAPGTGIL